LGAVGLRLRGGEQQTSGEKKYEQKYAEQRCGHRQPMHRFVCRFSCVRHHGLTRGGLVREKHTPHPLAVQPLAFGFVLISARISRRTSGGISF
jgi:hypothetical protein